MCDLIPKTKKHIHISNPSSFLSALPPRTRPNLLLLKLCGYGGLVRLKKKTQRNAGLRGDGRQETALTASCLICSCYLSRTNHVTEKCILDLFNQQLHQILNRTNPPLFGGANLRPGSLMPDRFNRPPHGGDYAMANGTELIPALLLALIMTLAGSLAKYSLTKHSNKAPGDPVPFLSHVAVSLFAGMMMCLPLLSQSGVTLGESCHSSFPLRRLPRFIAFVQITLSPPSFP